MQIQKEQVTSTSQNATQMFYLNTSDYALQLDQMDPLSDYRSLFEFPTVYGPNPVYFLGNSLGLMPKNALKAVTEEMQKWGSHGIEGYFKGNNPWLTYQEGPMRQMMGNMHGALPSEVLAMNTLTVNLHLLLTSFYRPIKERYKIICEAGAFSSDQYVIETQVKMHGLNPDEAIIELKPRDGEELLRTEDIITTIEKHGSSLCTILIGGINYLTGQYFDIEKITKAAHSVGAYAGWDLAHASGNVGMRLHRWGVDFAAWSNYKYVNAGPAAIGGMFVHEKHHNKVDELFRLGGWWGTDSSTRFLMEKGFKPSTGVDGWQMSCTPALLLAPLKASLEIFEKAGKKRIIRKQRTLTGYLEFVIEDVKRRLNSDIHIITPKDEQQRGSQLSIHCGSAGKKLYDGLRAEGVVTDWREPNVIRAAPAPLYNSYHDAFRFGEALEKVLRD